MILKAFNSIDSARISYLLANISSGYCMLIDPLEEEIKSYLRFINSKGFILNAICDTHIHSDNRSAYKTLLKNHNIKYYLYKYANVDIKYVPVDDNEIIELGGLKLKILHTPGHTEESISIYLEYSINNKISTILFSGDTLLWGGIGLPEYADFSHKTASNYYKSLEKIKQLPDNTDIYPTHILPSEFEQAETFRNRSNLLFEKSWNQWLLLNEVDFCRTLLKDRKPLSFSQQNMISYNCGKTTEEDIYHE